MLSDDGVGLFGVPLQAAGGGHAAPYTRPSAVPATIAERARLRYGFGGGAAGGRRLGPRWTPKNRPLMNT